mmetsp:Transcript_127132/g.245118  ORF Transcript_127132/g.245118 Transcript_127132/m.245118 type:complete len:80 (+) Transcript_127132:769-1008(+)
MEHHLNWFHFNQNSGCVAEITLGASNEKPRVDELRVRGAQCLGLDAQGLLVEFKASLDITTQVASKTDHAMYICKGNLL